ncbi:MAG: 4a-hydroxytetrahydrobiopterin dehydratase [Spirulina sp. SIO3F2]|nr:4a-hydroxytetrahydrobiopterin dehydratase [Spirulina sp. SIO3F2]
MLSLKFLWISPLVIGTLISHVHAVTLTDFEEQTDPFSVQPRASSPNQSFTLLSEAQIQSDLAQLPGWIYQDAAIHKVFTFPDFVAAIAFVTQLVEPAETASHHPDLKIAYNRVTVTLTTHDEGGVTVQDIVMAHTIEAIATPPSP